MKQAKKAKAKIKVTQKARVRKKSEQPKDTMKKAPVRVKSNGAVFRVKLRKKNG